MEKAKGFAMATGQKLLATLVKALGERSGQAVGSVKRLGVESGIRGSALFEAASGCVLHCDPASGKVKFPPLGRWKGTLTR